MTTRAFVLGGVCFSLPCLDVPRAKSPTFRTKKPRLQFRRQWLEAAMGNAKPCAPASCQGIFAAERDKVTYPGSGARTCGRQPVPGYWDPKLRFFPSFICLGGFHFKWSWTLCSVSAISNG
jgi:hypothetical protein